MDAAVLSKIIEKHSKWLIGDPDGECADLSSADLRFADLHLVDLQGANLQDANLQDANLLRVSLREANLRGANLYGANLQFADLRLANLQSANLCGANLHGANLDCANFDRAVLKHANLSATNIGHVNIPLDLMERYFPLCCPECGQFIAWKKANDYIVKLLIPEDAKRSSAFGRKCRASKALVLAIETMDGRPTAITEIPSDRDLYFIYRIGETVKVPDFDEDRRNECSTGIHFFITRREAVYYC